ncbi:uncharacterized protein LOC127188338 [Acomys russatus]|uniref:uncharacterized protein LOC127188338 n=1 Tax=Acomys russatus TaxID=60746 RepID=UPI0021E2620D|nr:uncharacterized protein LOC127188338 [Acomys russatus]
MRLSWIFLFLVCLFIRSHVLSEYSGFKQGHLFNVNYFLLIMSFLNIDFHFVTSFPGMGSENGNGSNTGLPSDAGDESIYLGDDVLELQAPVTSSSPENVSEFDQDIVDELDQYETNISDSLDTNGITRQLSIPAIHPEILAQEGLLSTVILNSQNLFEKREELQTLLLGGSVSFDVKNDLLEAAGTKAVEGLVCKGSLGGLCGHGSLSGMNDVLKNMDSVKLNSWLNVTRFDIVQLSWKASASSNPELILHTKLTINFSGMFSFLSGSMVDVNIVIPLGLQEVEPGQLSFSVKSCQAVFTGIQVETGVFSKMVDSMMKWSLDIFLPNLLCPVVRFWFYIINQQLAILKNITSFEMLGNISLPSTPQHMMYEGSYHMDFKDKNFPASFIIWLIKSKLSFSIFIPEPHNPTSLFSVEHREGS